MLKRTSIARICCFASGRISARCRQGQRGISLYTLLAAVVILGVMTSVAVTRFTGANARGEAGHSLLNRVAKASERFNADISCYPTNVKTLFDSSVGRSDNTCGQAFDESNWHGPYIREWPDADSGPSDSVAVSELGPSTRLSLDIGSDNRTGTNRMLVRLANVPSDTAKAIYEACGGNGSPCYRVGTGKVGSVVFAFGPAQ